LQQQGLYYLLLIRCGYVFGELKVNNHGEKLLDLDATEIVVLFMLMILTILFGVYPNLILEPISSSVDLVVKNMGAIK
jgi:NADH:ubiquinone oxidoreductase subunit 4 (subunit M)